MIPVMFVANWNPPFTCTYAGLSSSVIPDERITRELSLVGVTVLPSMNSVTSGPLPVLEVLYVAKPSTLNAETDSEGKVVLSAPTTVNVCTVPTVGL